MVEEWDEGDLIALRDYVKRRHLWVVDGVWRRGEKRRTLQALNQ